MANMGFQIITFFSNVRSAPRATDLSKINRPRSLFPSNGPNLSSSTGSFAEKHKRVYFKFISVLPHSQFANNTAVNCTTLHHSKKIFFHGCSQHLFRSIPLRNSQKYQRLNS